MSLYAVILHVLVFIYRWSLMIAFDILFNTYYLLKYYFFGNFIIEGDAAKIKVHRILWDIRATPQAPQLENDIDEFLKERYSYKSDPVYGLINWNWRFHFVAAINNFRGDCDDAAHFANWVFGDGTKYVIVPLNPKYWVWMHVVYVRNGKVYSGTFSGDMTIYNGSLRSYLDSHYISAGINVIYQKFL